MEEVKNQLEEQDRKIQEVQQQINENGKRSLQERVKFLEKTFLEFMSEYYSERRDMNEELREINRKLDQWTGSFRTLIWLIAFGLPAMAAIIAIAGYFTS